MNDRDLTHAALQWHAAHARRLAIGTDKRRLDKAIKAEGFVMFSAARAQQPEAARQLTEAKRKELAALRLLAKACAHQRGSLNAADVIDVDIKTVLLTSSECWPDSI
jgi:hypothetical protein